MESECQEDSYEESSGSQSSQSQFDGVLTVTLAGQHLSNLNWSADGTRQVFLDLNLQSLQLIDVIVLASFKYVQKLDLSFNELEDLSALSGMSALLHLNASHNNISRLLDFTPPNNLKTVNMSHNKITQIPEDAMSMQHYLQHLDLDNNSIGEITGLTSCCRLTYLSLRNNRIRCIQGLDRLPLKFLALTGNEIDRIANLENVCLLQRLELGGNKIRRLAGLERHRYLETINLEYNEIIDMAEVQSLSGLELLRRVTLATNPLCELPDYRLAVINICRQLTQLDGNDVTIKEKVSARNLFRPSIEYLAARDHIMHVVYSFLQPTRLLDITLPMQDSPYPMLVLVGPQGVGKKSLAQKLADELPDYFAFAASHTTRAPYSDEVNARDYHFVSLDEFESGIKMGAFLQTCSYHGELYGLSLEAVEMVARESLACVVHMELEGVLTLKNSYLEPRYVLLLPATRDAHERRLVNKGVYSAAQVEATLDRAEFYSEYNRQHPGLFDTTFMSDDISEMYGWLRSLVLQYLGVAATPTKELSDLDPTNTELSLDRVATGLLFYGPEADRDRILLRGRSAPAASNRTWSRPSNMDASRPQTSVQAHGAVEEASLKRRQSVIKETVIGSALPLYQQLLNRAVTAGSLRTSVEPVATKSPGWYSAPVVSSRYPPPATATSGEAVKDNNGDVSVDSSRTSHPEPCLSDSLEDAAAVPGGRSDGDVVPVTRRLPEDTVFDLATPSTNASCLSSSSRHRGGVSRRSSEPISTAALSGRTSAETSRPGSGKHPVLPPIRQLRSADTITVQ